MKLLAERGTPTPAALVRHSYYAVFAAVALFGVALGRPQPAHRPPRRCNLEGFRL